MNIAPREAGAQAGWLVCYCEHPDQRCGYLAAIMDSGISVRLVRIPFTHLGISATRTLPSPQCPFCAGTERLCSSPLVEQSDFPDSRHRIGLVDDGISAELTQFLRGIGKHGRRTDERLLPRVYQELHAIAEGLTRGHAGASSLVHEAYLKLFDRSALDLNDRHHFYALAAKAMRQILTDRARLARREKRGGGRRPVTLNEVVGKPFDNDPDLIDLDAALKELTRRNERQGQGVELRFYGGLEISEVAGVLGVSTPTIERDWRSARAWLGQRLQQNAAP